MSPSNAQMRFFHGKMLDQICSIIRVAPTRQNKEVVKRFLKRMYNIDSLTDLDTTGMMWLMTKTSIFFGTEFGVTLDMPGEESVDDMDLREFLKMIYHDTGNNETREDTTDPPTVHEDGLGDV